METTPELLITIANRRMFGMGIIPANQRSPRQSFQDAVNALSKPGSLQTAASPEVEPKNKASAFLEHFIFGDPLPRQFPAKRARRAFWKSEWNVDSFFCGKRGFYLYNGVLLN